MATLPRRTVIDAGGKTYPVGDIAARGKQAMLAIARLQPFRIDQ